MIAQYAKFSISKDKWKKVHDDVEAWKKEHGSRFPGLRNFILARNHINGHAEVLAIFENADQLKKFDSDQSVLTLLDSVREAAGSDGDIFEVEVY